MYIRVVFLAGDPRFPGLRARLFEPAAEDPIPGRSAHRKTCENLHAPAGKLVRNPGATAAHLSCQLSAPSGRKRVHHHLTRTTTAPARSEERRVGKECRSRRQP